MKKLIILSTLIISLFSVLSGQTANLVFQGDEFKTAMGLKQYYTSTGSTTTGDCTTSGTTLRICVARNGLQRIHAVFIPYKMADGIWRLKFNISYHTNLTSGAFTGHLTYINGIRFANREHNAPAVSHWDQSIGQILFAYPSLNTNYLYADGSSRNTDTFGWSGDVELAEKPAWAD